MSTSVGSFSNKHSWYKSLCAKVNRANRLQESDNKDKTTKNPNAKSIIVKKEPVAE